MMGAALKVNTTLYLTLCLKQTNSIYHLTSSVNR